MKIFSWLLGLLLILGTITAVAMLPIAIYFKWFYILLFGAFITLLRLSLGPTTADRAAAMKVLSVLVIGFCCILTTISKAHIYIDIAIAWTFQAFVGTLIFAKYTEGKSLDE